MSGKPKKAPASSVEELREATRAAHEAIKTIRTERQHLETEREALARAKDAMWADIAKLVRTASASIDEAQEQRLAGLAPEIAAMIKDTERAVQDRFVKILLGFLAIGEDERDAGNAPLEVMLAAWYDSLGPDQRKAARERAGMLLGTGGNTGAIESALSKISAPEAFVRVAPEPDVESVLRTTRLP